MYKKIALLSAGVLIFTGCCKRLELVDCSSGCVSQNVKVTKSMQQPSTMTNRVNIVKKVKKPQRYITLEARGVGVVPCEGTCSKAQAIAMARRAAILDAYKALAEKIYGIRINGRDSVKNMALVNSSIRAYVDGVIRGATITEESFKEGIYSVVMSVKLDKRKFNSIIASML
jgi:hypothetical protein